VNHWYEKVVSGSSTTTYWLGSEMVAVHETGHDTVWVHTDSLGSPVTWTAPGTGKGTTAVHAYLPWGGTRAQTGTTYTARDFTGQLKDGASGLHFYNARYYDSVLGRFLSPDSIVPNPRDARDFNRFTYVTSNPLKYTDPNGHDPCSGQGTECWASVDPALLTGYMASPITSASGEPPGTPAAPSVTTYTGADGHLYEVTVIPVILVVNPLLPDGSYLFSSEAQYFLVPYTIVDNGGCSGALQCVFGRGRSFAPPGQMINTQERSLQNAGLIAHEVFHHVEQQSGMTEFIWFTQYAGELVKTGGNHSANSFEARANQIQELVRQGIIAFEYRFEIIKQVRDLGVQPQRLPVNPTARR
jgi:RHS repeat-associated protein